MRVVSPAVRQVLDFRDLPTPSSTPVLMRKNKKANSNVQKSNSFSVSDHSACVRATVAATRVVSSTADLLPSDTVCSCLSVCGGWRGNCDLEQSQLHF